MNVVENIKNVELKNLLDDWNLSHIYKYFIEQNVTIQVLKLMQSKHIERLFQNRNIGDQVLFEHKLEQWKQGILLGHTTTITQKSQNTTLATKKVNEPIKVIDITENCENNSNIDAVEFISFHTAATPPESTVIEAPPIASPAAKPLYPTVTIASQVANLPVAASPVPQTSNVQIPLPSTTASGTTANDSLINPLHLDSPISAAKRPTPNLPPQQADLPKGPRFLNVTQTLPCRYSLRNILDETSGGQMIANYYENHKILREEHRNTLINVITRYIDANGWGLTVAESNHLENEILEMFPTEKREFYRTTKRGRIYNKYANMKRVYKKFTTKPAEPPAADKSLSSAPSSPSDLIKEEETIDQFDEYSIHEFRANHHTPEDFLGFWKKSQHIRLKHIDEIESLQQILEQWPEYKQHHAVEFIEMDFRAKYPEATVFSEVFEANFKKLEKCLFDKVSPSSAGIKYLHQYHNCDTESQHLLILWLLHQLFPPNQKTIVDEMGNKRKKRHSIQDSQNAFMCIRSSYSSLEAAVKFYQSIVTPPIILIVGELAQEVEQVYVYFEGTQFPVQSVIKAAQLCCELYFLFNLDYAEQARLFFSFCQTYFMNIEPEVKNTKIYTIINEINAS